MLIDATQPISTGMPKAPTLPDVNVEPMRTLESGDQVATSQLSIPSHAGTHMDAPSHVVKGGKTIDEIPIDRFVGMGVVSRVARGPGDLISVQDILAGGPEIAAGEMLFIDTGWAKKFGTEEYYTHPSLSIELADWCVEKQVNVVGMDFVTPDLSIPERPDGFDFPVHHVLLGNDVLIIENTASLEEASGQRVKVYAMPLLVRGGDAGHVRLLMETS